MRKPAIVSGHVEERHGVSRPLGCVALLDLSGTSRQLPGSRARRDDCSAQGAVMPRASDSLLVWAGAAVRLRVGSLLLCRDRCGIAWRRAFADPEDTNRASAEAPRSPLLVSSCSDALARSQGVRRPASTRPTSAAPGGSTVLQRVSRPPVLVQSDHLHEGDPWRLYRRRSTNLDESSARRG